VRRTRLALLAAATAVTTATTLAGAATTAPATLVTDPAGDARGLGASYDIISADLRTTGTTKKVGKKVTYTPTALVAQVTLSGPPSTATGYSVNFFADTSACGGGYFQWGYSPGNAILGDGNLFVSGCGTDNGTGAAEFFDSAAPVVSGNTITWTLSLKEIGADLPLGSTFTAPTVYADFNDPATGLVGTSLVSGAPVDTAIDSATAAVTYTLK
jgi:hypothetical protein